MESVLRNVIRNTIAALTIKNLKMADHSQNTNKMPILNWSDFSNYPSKSKFKEATYVQNLLRKGFTPGEDTKAGIAREKISFWHKIPSIYIPTSR